MSLVQLTNNISYLPASVKPLSCDVIFIKTNKATWIFDVGLCSQAVEEIKKIEGPKNIVISHFHPDHILNLPRISFDNLYVSKNTKKYTFRGTVVESTLVFDEDPKITILELPSSHAKGCLCLVCQDYVFLGDGTYCKEVIKHHSYNAQKLQEMIGVMEKIDAKYFCMSHDQHFVQLKENVINLYKDIYKRREANNPIISVEDFFNEDGSVKTDSSS